MTFARRVLFGMVAALPFAKPDRRWAWAVRRNGALFIATLMGRSPVTGRALSLSVEWDEEMLPNGDLVMRAMGRCVDRCRMAMAGTIAYETCGLAPLESTDPYWDKWRAVRERTLASIPKLEVTHG